MVPPKGLMFTGSGDYLEVGQRYLGYFIRYAGLMPHHYVLDVGCGVGRMAVALTGYLDQTARYDGFDVVKQGIHWCQEHVTTSYPNFQFRQVEVINDLYIATGKKAQHFTFPYESSSYDVTIVISVFTHMIYPEVEHYLTEIHRTLKDKGVLFITLFLLNDVARNKMQQQDFRFDYMSDGCYLMNPDVMSANVAYDEVEIDWLLQKTGFMVRHRFYGTWSGRSESTLDFQDIMVLEKSK